MELNSKDFFMIYIFFVATIAILVLAMMIIGKTGKRIRKKKRKRKNNPTHRRTKVTARTKKANNQNEAHSELYLSYYGKIGTMSFQELDRMRSVLGEYYDDLCELECLPALIHKGRAMNDDDRAKIAEYRNREIKGRPYGCRTYGEASDLVAKAYENKEYWTYVNK